jgi:DNA-binding GntR family transcriptional regulator
LFPRTSKYLTGIHRRPSDFPKQSMCDKVETYIRWKLLNGEFVGGDKIGEQTIAREVDVSRTLVREATRRLFGAGLLEIDSQRGVFVKTFSIGQIQDLIDVRIALSRLTARLFVERATLPQKEKIVSIYSKLEQVRDETYSDNDYFLSLQFFHEFLKSIKNDRVYFLDREAWQQMRIFKLFLQKKTFGEFDVTAFNRSMFFQGCQNRARLFEALSVANEDMIAGALQISAKEAQTRALELYQEFLGSKPDTWNNNIVQGLKNHNKY